MDVGYSSCSPVTAAAVRQLQLHSLLLLMLLHAVLPHQPPPVIQPTDKRTFQDMENSKYFRYLQLDARRGHLYVGALEYVYRLELSDISSYERSDKLPATESDHTFCLGVTGRTQDDCRNHIRSILIEDNSIYVCGTGSYAPREFTLDKTTLKRISYGEANSGVGKCPFSPDQESTSVLIRSGNPNGLPAMYFGTAADSTGDVSLIYRPKLSQDTDYVRTIPKSSKWLNKPDFVGSFEVGDYVYFFFREFALESMNCEKAIYSRVARVCKKDQGGVTPLSKTWTTYLKARLNCSISGEFPFYFDNIRDVQQIGTTRFYALFTTSSMGIYGSAVCEFTLDTIEKAFNGAFKEQLDSTRQWTATLPSEIPQPRPGQCSEDSRNLPEAVCQFIKSRPLMDEAVQAGDPLHYQGNVRYDRMVVDFVKRYTIFFLATDKGSIHKIVQWQENNQVKSKQLAEWQVTDEENKMPIRRLQLYNNKLYVAQDYQIVQYDVSQCDSYTLCTDCIQDPYCGWHIWTDKCVKYDPSSSSSVKQNVETETPITTCNTQCRVLAQDQQTTVRMQGDTVHLTCPSRCSSSDPIKWFIYSRELNTFSPIDFKRDSYRNMMLTSDNNLLITNVTRYNMFQCQIGDILIAKHSVYVPECNDAECLWREEFHKWCTAFDKYTNEFNQWLCLKKNCVDNNNCIPNTISNQCIGN